ncbi:MAG TPA: Gfo/Idh/MocA family oxidoreductase, partial [Limnochordia bacterium]
MSSIGIGIISFAHGHAHTYAHVLARDARARLVAVWDDDPERGRQAAARYETRFVPELDALLSDPGIQAVIVTSETYRHAEHVCRAAAAGKHILCQKPMALSLADCDRMGRAVDAAGVTFVMAFQMRHDPLNQKLKELIDAGAVGRVGLVRRRHCIDVLFNEAFVRGPSRWHIEPEKNMGMFMDDAVHAADFLLWILGEPKSVTAEIDNVLTHVAPDDTGVAIYRFADGAMGVLLNSSVTLAAENTTEVYGDQGVIIQNWDDGPSLSMGCPPGAAPLKLYRRGQPRQWETFDIPLPQNHGGRIAAVPGAFLDVLLSGAPSPIPWRVGRKSVEMILGAYRA